MFAKAYLLLQTGAHHQQAITLLEESLRLLRKLGDKTRTVWAISVLGHAALRAGELHRSLMLNESLTLMDQVDDDLLVGQCLWATAVAAAATGQSTRAVRLWSAATAFQYRLAVPPFIVRPLEERLLVPARNQLTPEAARAEWITGQSMRREEAISTVLGR